MQVKKLALPVLLAAFIVTSPAVLAQEEDQGPSVRERVEQELEVVREELNLSDYKWAQVELILKSGIRERVAIVQRYGLDGTTVRFEDLSGKDQRRMRKDLKESLKNTEDRMERYLDKEQMKTFEEFQERQRDELLARLEQRETG
jgi:C-terminal processing protease CtpA/Prc